MERIGPEATLAILEARTVGPGERIPTLAEYLEAYLEHLGSYATPGTVRDYRSMAARTWLDRLGELPLDAVDRQQVSAWIAWQRGQETVRSQRARARARREGRPLPPSGTYSPKAIKNAHGLLFAVLEFAVENEIITRNLAKGAKLPTDHETAERVYLSSAEFTRVYGEIPAHYRPLVATLYGTGMRWSEATALAVGDVDLDAGVITVRQAWKRGDHGCYLGSPKSRRGSRSITIAGGLVELLRETIRGRASDELVFVTPGGCRVASQNFHPRVWHRAVAASGISKRPDIHALRHSHVAALIRARVQLPVIQRRLGHESIKTTVDTYGHLAPDSVAGAAEAADVALAPALPQIGG